MNNFTTMLNKKVEDVHTSSTSVLNTGHVIGARTNSKLLAKMAQFESDFNCRLVPVNFSKG